MPHSYEQIESKRAEAERNSFHVGANEAIAKHLKIRGIEGLDALALELAVLGKSSGVEIQYGPMGNEDDDESPDIYRLAVSGTVMPTPMTMGELILSQVIIAKMVIFDASAIIDLFDISVPTFIDRFDGIEDFSEFTEDGILVDPLVLSIGAVQGLALDTRAFRRFQSTAHESYMAFAALVGSGAATGYVSSELKVSSRRGDVLDLIVGSLDYLSHKDHLPNGSISHYLQSVQALDPNILTQKYVLSNSWEHVFCQASGPYVEKTLSQQITETLFSTSFLSVNKDAVECLFVNLNTLGDMEFPGTTSAYKKILDAANGTELAPIFERINIKLNFAGYGAFAKKGTLDGKDDWIPLFDEFDRLGSGLLRQALIDAMETQDSHLGLSTFLLPSLVKTAAGKVKQVVDPKTVADFFGKTISPCVDLIDFRKSERDGDLDSQKIIQGYSYLMSLPGVEALVGKTFDQLPSRHQDFMIGIGLQAKHMKGPSSQTLEKVISRDLGL